MGTGSGAAAGQRMNARKITACLRLSLAIFLLAVLVLTCISCGRPSLPDKTERAIESAVDRMMSENKIPGAIVGVKIPGEGELVVAKGKADIETGRDIDPGDMLRIGSVTKTFTITVLLRLVDEGRIGLDDALDGYFPEIPNSADITIRQLANMTSGLFDYTQDKGLLETLSEDTGRKWTPKELLEAGISNDPYFPPGEGFHYSNTNYLILGMIVEQLTGNNLAKEIDTRIIKKLRLDETLFPSDRSIPGRHSHGYMFDVDGRQLKDVTVYLDPSFSWAAGAMISDLDDLETWARALATGELLSKDTQKQRLTWVKGQVGNFPFEYGLGIARVNGFIGHGGDIPGYSCAEFYHPDRNATVVVLLNKDPNGTEAAGLSLSKEISKIILEPPR